MNSIDNRFIEIPIREFIFPRIKLFWLDFRTNFNLSTSINSNQYTHISINFRNQILIIYVVISREKYSINLFPNKYSFTRDGQKERFYPNYPFPPQFSPRIRAKRNLHRTKILHLRSNFARWRVHKGERVANRECFPRIEQKIRQWILSFPSIVPPINRGETMRITRATPTTFRKPIKCYKRRIYIFHDLATNLLTIIASWGSHDLTNDKDLLGAQISFLPFFSSTIVICLFSFNSNYSKQRSF